jgi:hypothetical protein
MIKIRIVFVSITILLFSGCVGGENKESKINEGDIIQKLDESIFLSLKDAYLLYDDNNPDINTAEWGFTVNSTGRYEVWLSSLTKDTMNLSYNEPVIVHFENTRLESQPVGNQIVLNDDHVSKPYFRADSKLGSILIEDTGHYNLQIVSEKVLPNTENTDLTGVNTILDQIILRPQEY